MNIRLNDNFARIKPSYLFSDVAKRVRAYAEAHPDKKILRLGIGDVTLPLTPTVIRAMHKATDEMADAATFRGYAPEYGYDFLREAVTRHYASFGVTVPSDDVFISDGAKSDLGNFVDLFADVPVLVPDPVYPVYVDSNLMAGREIEYMEGNEGNGFLPTPAGLSDTPRLIYLCSPNNPTGAVYSAAGLAEWVEFALRTGSLILFDSAYEAFISDGSPRSIYAIKGAERCAVEFCSLSKTAGFTGTRCGWTVVPAALGALKPMWERRQATKFNGVPYVVQRAAEAALSPEGMAECMANIAYYKENAALIADLLEKKSIPYTGGLSSPYLWLKCPGGVGSWEFFDKLLCEAQVVGTPGAGFGRAGEGYFRLTAFGSRENTREAVQRLDELL
ncbi:MAG: LL-diaminopimelate aminotransferase [Clostridia bacterium]|nr:LL-diaminopimelate aminotransferase [Clostridia bacterium]MBR5043921.1 LL-diaminopimelate aminotransferase [Clostridia bacterium]